MIISSMFIVYCNDFLFFSKFVKYLFLSWQVSINFHDKFHCFPVPGIFTINKIWRMLFSRWRFVSWSGERCKLTRSRIYQQKSDRLTFVYQTAATLRLHQLFTFIRKTYIDIDYAAWCDDLSCHYVP